MREYERKQKTNHEKWEKMTSIYQAFVDKTSAAADAKYGTHTAFNAQFTFIQPDFTELKKKVAEVPKLEDKSPIEYWQVLNDLTGKEGGISEAERAGVVTWIALRSGVIELLSAFFLFMGLQRVKKYYNRPNNILSEKEEKILHRYYESIVIAIQKTFS